MSRSQGQSSGEGLIAAAYDAALGAKGWDEVLDQLRPFFGGCAAVFGVKEVGRGWGAQVGVDPAIMRVFFERHSGRNPLAERAAAAPVGAVMPDQSQMPKSDLMRTDFYNDCLRPQDMHSLLNLRAARGRGNAVADLCVVRGKQQDEFGAQEVGLLRLLAPHLCRAVSVTLRLAEAEAERQALREALERLPWAAFILDDVGHLHFTNAAAAGLLRTEALRVDPSGGLSVARNADTSALRQIVAAALPAGQVGQAGRLRISREPPHGPLLVTAIPLRAAAAAIVGFAAVPSVLLLVVSPDMEVAPVPVDLIQSAFGLTWAEAAVAQRVGRGEALPVVAAALGISPSTARTHLNSIFGKTGTHRQAELTALLMRLMPEDRGATRR